MVDYIADYLENIRDRRVFPDVKPGYLREMLPDVAPNQVGKTQIFLEYSIKSRNKFMYLYF